MLNVAAPLMLLLLHRCLTGHLDCVNAMIGSGCDLGTTNVDGMSAEGLAKSQGHYPCAEAIASARWKLRLAELQAANEKDSVVNAAHGDDVVSKAKSSEPTFKVAFMSTVPLQKALAQTSDS
eukprot:m.184481 g.184481  ORF g.184481 m.184481 type:complete len:122 (-) comp18488_c0_seq39:3024-3389(-)